MVTFAHAIRRIKGDLDRFVIDIRSMDPAWRDEVRQPKPDEASNTGYPLDLQPGRTLMASVSQGSTAVPTSDCQAWRSSSSSRRMCTPSSGWILTV